jgi:hypothetical protein
MRKIRCNLQPAVVTRTARHLLCASHTPARAPCAGKVVIEFEDANVAMRARNALHGRKFGGHEVEAFFLPEHLYSQGTYELPQ